MKKKYLSEVKNMYFIKYHAETYSCFRSEGRFFFVKHTVNQCPFKKILLGSYLQTILYLKLQVKIIYLFTITSDIGTILMNDITKTFL